MNCLIGWPSPESSYLIVPYSLETNDNRFDQNHGFNKADDFFAYLKDCFDLLYEEGADRPKLMSIAIHDRLIGRPARGRRPPSASSTM